MTGKAIARAPDANHPGGYTGFLCVCTVTFTQLIRVVQPLPKRRSERCHESHSLASQRICSTGQEHPEVVRNAGPTPDRCCPWVCILASIPRSFCAIEFEEHYTVRWWNSSRAQGFKRVQEHPSVVRADRQGACGGICHTHPCVCRETDTRSVSVPVI